MIESLCVLLKTVMNRKGRSFVSLQEEIRCVDAYLDIARQRFGEGLFVTKDVDADLLQYPVPNFILQPIVENAVEHGGTRKGKTRIGIRAYRTDSGDLVLEIEDDGRLTDIGREKIKAILEDNADAGQNGESLPAEARRELGLRNVNRRLKILCGSDSGISLESGEDGCTIFRIRIVKACS